MADIASSVVSTTIELLGKLDPSVQKAFQAAEKQAGGSGKKIGAALAAGIGAVSVAVGAVIKQIADIGDEYQQASGQIAAATGATGAELEDLQDVMKNVYADNFGESMEDVGDAIATVKQQMKGLGDSGLQNVTESAFLLRDVFEYDIPESVRAADAIMDNFGTTGEYAMALIATGAQNGLDYSGELLDSISEYSVQFKKVGFSADDMFNIMQKGAETGAFNLDKVGDAIKEFSIRAVDGSDTTAEGFKLLGLNAEEMAAKFAAGGDTAREAFFQVAGALASMEDPLKQNTAGVDLFGTMWEDLGPDVVSQLSQISDEAYATEEALAAMGDVKYNSLSSALEGLKRKVDVALIPIGDGLASAASGVLSQIGTLVDQAAPYIESFANTFAEGFGRLVDWLGPYVIPIIQTVKDGIAGLAQPLQTIWNSIQPIIPILKQLAEAIFPVLQTWVSGFIQYVQILAGHIANILTPVMQFLIPVLQQIANNVIWLIQQFEAFLSFVQSVFLGVWSAIYSVISNVISFLSSAWSAIFSTAQAVWNSITSFLTGIFEGIKTKVSEFVENVKNKISEGFNALKDIMSAPFDAIIGTIDKVKGAIGGLISKITGAKSEAASIQVPAYASGGTITTPQLAVVGDAPETIVPHGNTPHNRQLLAEAASGVGAGFGDSYVINFNVTVSGNVSGDVRAQILEAEQEFERRMDAYFARRSRRAFA